MSQFIYHIIYIIKDRINSTNTSQQPYNMTTLPEKIKDIQKLNITSPKVPYAHDYDLMFLLHS